MKTCCGYSLEAPCGGGGTSNEYPQHMFSWRNKKNIFQILPFIQTYGLPDNLSLLLFVFSNEPTTKEITFKVFGGTTVLSVIKQA